MIHVYIFIKQKRTVYLHLFWWLSVQFDLIWATNLLICCMSPFCCWTDYIFLYSILKITINPYSFILTLTLYTPIIVSFFSTIDDYQSLHRVYIKLRLSFHYMSMFNTYEFKGVVPTIDKNKLGVLSLCLLELLEVTTLRECLSSSAKNSFVLYDALCPNPINNATRRKRVSRKICMLRERVFFHRTCWLLLYMHIKNIACMRDVDKKAAVCAVW